MNCPLAGRRAHTVTAPAAIDATGKADVSVPLRAWLQSLPAGTEARLRAGGRYRAESPIELDAKRALTINGRGASLVRTVAGDPADPKTRTRSSIDLQGGADIVIKGVNIHGRARPEGTALPRRLRSAARRQRRWCPGSSSSATRGS